jgi:glutathione peroxidase
MNSPPGELIPVSEKPILPLIRVYSVFHPWLTFRLVPGKCRFISSGFKPRHYPLIPKFDNLPGCSKIALMKIITAFLLALGIAQIVSAQSTTSLYDIPLKDIDGKDTSLKAYQGKVLLVVNVASKCGYTPQYEGLEALQKKYAAQGFTVLGFPCNDFKSQEPGTAEEIKQFCTSTYEVTFPLFAKLHVDGKEQHPLYAALTGTDSPFPGKITWNFNKFLIGRDGKIVKRFDSADKPESPKVTKEIDSALAVK